MYCLKNTLSPNQIKSEEKIYERDFWAGISFGNNVVVLYSLIQKGFFFIQFFQSLAYGFITFLEIFLIFSLIHYLCIQNYFLLFVSFFSFRFFFFPFYLHSLFALNSKLASPWRKSTTKRQARLEIGKHIIHSLHKEHWQ